EFWHDGQPITVDDVVFTISVLQNPNVLSPPDLTELWRSVKVEKLNENTVRFTRTEPLAPFLDFTQIGLLPKHIYEKVPPQDLANKTLNMTPVGSGPLLVKELAADHVRLEPSPFYAGKTPYLSALELWFYPDYPSLFNAFAKGEIDEGKKCFMRPVKDYRRAGNMAQEAFWWEEMADYLPDNENTYNDEISGFENALALYKKLNLKKEEPSILESIGYVHMNRNRLGLAEAYFLQGINARIVLNDKRLFPEYSKLTEITLSEGNYNKAVHYAQQAIKYIDTTSNRSVAGVIFYKMRQAYDALDETDSSFRCYKQSLNLLVEKNTYLFPALRKVINGLIEKDSAGSAFIFLEDFLKKNTPM
ncbi:MAG: ABC transporter substrate-binding protein, partial [Bacteroidota bacterium]